MTTHGTIAIRREREKDEVFVFHVNRDGYNVEDFMKRNEKPKSVDSLIIDAVRFIGEDHGEGYSDHMHVNLYSEPHNPDGNYSDMTEYSVFYTGDEWEHNIDQEE